MTLFHLSYLYLTRPHKHDPRAVQPPAPLRAGPDAPPDRWLEPLAASKEQEAVRLPADNASAEEAAGQAKVVAEAEEGFLAGGYAYVPWQYEVNIIPAAAAQRYCQVW